MFLIRFSTSSEKVERNHSLSLIIENALALLPRFSSNTQSAIASLRVCVHPNAPPLPLSCDHNFLSPWHTALFRRQATRLTMCFFSGGRCSRVASCGYAVARLPAGGGRVSLCGTRERRRSRDVVLRGKERVEITAVAVLLKSKTH